MQINERLHLVVPIYADDLETITAYVHSAPLSRDVFKANFLLISKTFAAIFAENLGPWGGPRVAELMLHQVAKQMGDPVAATSLMNEIRRLSNVLTRTPNGWEPLQFQDAINQKMISEDDLSEVTNAIVYFIVASAMYPRHQLRTMTESVMKAWGAQISSLDFTAFPASLETLTTVTDTAPIPVSSVAF